MKIFKYPLAAEINVIQMPAKSTVLSCGIDLNNIPCIWALVNEDSKEEELRTIYCEGTGWPLNVKKVENSSYYFFAYPKGCTSNGELCTFLGTVNDGEYIWHIFCSEPH